MLIIKLINEMIRRVFHGSNLGKEKLKLGYRVLQTSFVS